MNNRTGSAGSRNRSYKYAIIRRNFVRTITPRLLFSCVGEPWWSIPTDWRGRLGRESGVGIGRLQRWELKMDRKRFLHAALPEVNEKLRPRDLMSLGVTGLDLPASTVVGRWAPFSGPITLL
jgi:hypothetical protein